MRKGALRSPRWETSRQRPMKFVRHTEQRKIRFDMTYLAKSGVVDGREDAIQKISVSTTIGREADGPVPTEEE